MYNVKLSSDPIFPLKVNKTHVQKRRFMIKLDLFDFMYVKVVKNLEIKNNNYTCRLYLCFILRNKQINVVPIHLDRYTYCKSQLANWGKCVRNTKVSYYASF